MVSDRYLVEAVLSMLVDVETLFLDTLVHSQTGNLLDGEEQYRSRHSSPGVDGQDAETLCSEETETASVESTAVYSQQTGHQSAENAAYAMYGTCPTGSSMWSLVSMNSMENTRMMPACRPMMVAPSGDTKSHPMDIHFCIYASFCD